MSDPTWISTERHSTLSDLNPATNIERMLSPQNTHKEDDGKSSDFLLTFFHSANPFSSFYFLFYHLGYTVFVNSTIVSEKLRPHIGKTGVMDSSVKDWYALLCFCLNMQTLRHMVSIRANKSIPPPILAGIV